MSEFGEHNKDADNSMAWIREKALLDTIDRYKQSAQELESALAHVRGAAKWLLDCPDAMKAEATAELRKAIEKTGKADENSAGS